MTESAQVADVRSALNGHSRVLNALRETQMDQITAMLTNLTGPGSAAGQN